MRLNSVLASSANTWEWKSTNAGSTWRQVLWSFAGSGSTASLSIVPPPIGE
ncbi:MAG TPA: hypothetical protein VF813_01885 [Anaerolineaceae bacterium]